MFFMPINLFIKLLFIVLLLFSCKSRVEDYDKQHKNIIVEDTISIEIIKIPTH